MEISISSGQTYNADTAPVLSELGLRFEVEATGVEVSELNDGKEPPLYQVTLPADGGKVVLTLDREELSLLGDRITTAVFDG